MQLDQIMIGIKKITFHCSIRKTAHTENIDNDYECMT